MHKRMTGGIKNDRIVSGMTQQTIPNTVVLLLGREDN